MILVGIRPAVSRPGDSNDIVIVRLKRKAVYHIHGYFELVRSIFVRSFLTIAEYTELLDCITRTDLFNTITELQYMSFSRPITFITIPNHVANIRMK